jgi:hypothetical protein
MFFIGGRDKLCGPGRMGEASRPRMEGSEKTEGMGGKGLQLTP